jgi:2-dehydropantoate 2-reductase
MTTEPLNIAVLGPGGVGGLLAALLARSGNSAEVLGGEGTAHAIAEQGLQVESQKFGNFHVDVRSATYLTHAVDACLIAVKNTQLSAALERVPVSVLGDGLVVPLLNGIEHLDLLRAVYPPSSVAAATIRIETTRVGPGRIRHTSPFAAIEVAASSANRDRVELLAAGLEEAGVTVRVRGDELPMLWEKLSFLAPVALLTTHERANVGAVRTRRREDVLAVIAEVAAVAGAEGAVIDADAVIRVLDSVPEAMESSMQRDQAAGQPLEVDAIGGAVVRRAARVGIDVPVTARLVDELRSRG